MSEVAVVYRKYDGALHWNLSGRYLGEDEHGRWVGFTAGTTARRGTELEVVWELPAVVLFPRDAWWTAMFNAAPHEAALYCDVTTVPKWCGDPAVERQGDRGRRGHPTPSGTRYAVTMVDLDLDVIRRTDGRVFLDDEDEFAEHQVRLAYPPEVVAQAQRSATWLMTAVDASLEPFGGAHERWLGLVGR